MAQLSLCRITGIPGVKLLGERLKKIVAVPFICSERYFEREGVPVHT
jgi:hypothetical protein